LAKTHMSVDEAIALFCRSTAATRPTISTEAFGSVFRELTDRKPRGEGFTDEDALSLMCEWYEAEAALVARYLHTPPLKAIETYRRPRVWVIFLAQARGRGTQR
jgi:hypothetical protein